MTRNLKIISGLILFAFVALHLTNLALGVFSLRLADTLRPWLMAPFTNPVGGPVLLVAMLLHMVLGLQALYQRNSLRMSRYDTVQFASAVLVPPLLIPHVWSVIANKQLLGGSPSYLGIFEHFWVESPLDGLRQVLLVVIIWIHGCIGLFTWLKLKPWWARYAKFAYPLAVAIPVLALLGFVAGGNHILGSVASTAGSAQPGASEIRADYAEPRSMQKPERPQPPHHPDRLDPDSQEYKQASAFIEKTKWQLVVGYVVLLMLVLVARLFRVRSSGQTLEVQYATGQKLTRQVGPTLLELANMNDIPHANLCRGRGRCGTCRVEIIDAQCSVEPPSKMEQATLSRMGSAANVRLACQLSPGPGIIRIKRLLPPNIQPADIVNNEPNQTTVTATPLLTSSSRGTDA